MKNENESWLNDKEIETDEPITYAAFRAEYKRGFDEGVKFAAAMIEGKSDTEAEAAMCKVCRVMPVDEDELCDVCGLDINRPYFSKSVGYPENAKIIKIGNIRV